MTYGGEYDRTHPLDTGAAMVNYAFLIVSPFTLGFLAVVALIVAYARKGGADPMTATHYAYQIRSFWKDFIILLLGTVCAVLAIAGGFGGIVGSLGIPLPSGIGAGDATMWAIGFGIGWLIFWVWGILGLMFGSIGGALRLAGRRPMRH